MGERAKRGGGSRAEQRHAQNKIWTEHHACQRLFKASTWQRYFEVACQKVGGCNQSRTEAKHDFFRAQENDVRQAKYDATEDANRVHGFGDHVSAVVPWLRETGIADHINDLKKDEIRTAMAVPRLGDESDLRVITEAMESLLRDAHRLCFDGPDCMLTYQCRVLLSRVQPSQVDLTGKTRPFDPYKGPKSLVTYFGALRFVWYFSRVVSPDEYHFSPAADNDGETMRPEDIIQATEEQLVVWQDIHEMAKQMRMNEQTGTDDHLDLRERLRHGL